MSWLGDQFSSITGKITDFTKEVLIENNSSGLTDEESNQNGVLSFKELVDLCKEKDQKIEQLMQEKENLEQSIEELDQQHREHYSKDINFFENSSENLCTNSNTGKDNGIEAKLLQEKVSALELEKGKLLCVLNEKSQECSTLKTEVHKLTSIVASEKQALLKLQQDNCELKLSSKEKSDPELTKETIKKLSNIIRDKDFEIESLKQKNSTLTTLIQETSNIPEHLQSLLEEKENLAKQIKMCKTEREKFMVSYNTKDKECRKYMAEMKELETTFSQQREKFDLLEQTHQSLVQQYEEKQKSLINVQNEMIILKQRLADLEQQHFDIKEKYSNFLNQMNSDAIIQITKDELQDKNTKIEQLTCANEEKDHLIQEKDCMIHDLSQQVKKLKLESEQQQQITQTLEKKISDSMNKVADMKNSLEDLENEKTVLEQKLQDKDSECSLLKDMNERLNMAVKEQEFSIQSMTEKLSSLSQYINSDHSSPSGTVDINQILADSEAMFSKAQDLYRERDETLLALNQSKQENQNLRNEIQRMKSNEIHLKNELERLRQHLLEIEENYTTEALKAEERQKRLQDELVEVKRRAEITSTAVVDTNQRASIQIASLQEQLSIIANQRDEALSHISSLEDQVLQHSTSVNKLQLVLEQMQRANERKLKEVENKWQLLLDKEKMAYKKLSEQLLMKERQLEESSQALEAASRLSEQLDAKEEIIANLRNELSKTEHKIKSTTLEIDTIKSNTEGKVDRLVMKSLVLGYFSTPPNQKSEVIRLLARVLDFNQEEMEKAGIVVGRQSKNQENRGIFSSIFGRLPRMSSEQQQQRQYEPEKSFTTLFVQFLEHESQPIVPMPFPVEKMTQEVTHHKSHLIKKPQSQQNQGSPRKSPLLLDIDSAFPSFTPVPAIEYSASPAPAILKEVLEKM
ncbi:Thyroid receptor-interacting protein 11 like protein [Argiope bruennichi]|uniref:Thyroid receptor-interacting protein 11 like protein n=1 Tax=Argiope bruennichi TaxID=94029 RepID=A0A8T0FT09_ARGBR|nr:Thyroid receptor-interacting protein 11 like protein [Argiope bruennichi]